MAWTTFSSNTAPANPQLDANLTYLSNMSMIPCTIVGTNVLTLTTTTNMPTMTALATNMIFMGIIANSNTGTTTATINSFGPYNVYKFGQSGPTILIGGELISGCIVELVFDGSLNGGAGGLQIISSVQPLGNSVSALGSGFVNKFRNAALDIWQRGTAITVTAGGNQYTADGWIVGATGANATVTQAGGRLLSYNSLQIMGNTGLTDTYLRQRIGASTASPLNAQTVTCQGWIYNGIGADIFPTLTVKSANAYNDFSALTTVLSVSSFSSCINGTWTQIGYTFVMNSLAVNGLQVDVGFDGLLNAAGKYIKMAEFDIRPTPGWALNRTPLFFFTPELRPTGVEWPRCQRFLPGFNALPDATAWGPLAQGGSSSTSVAGLIFEYYNHTRTAPTSIIVNGAASTWALIDMGITKTVTATAVPVFVQASTRAAFCTIGTAGSLSASFATYYLTPNVSTSYILFGGCEF